jgi:subtilisin family serine protease
VLRAVAALVSALAASAPASGRQPVPAAVVQATARVEIAIVDTGANVSLPELAARHPLTYDTRTRTSNVRDTNGHGTFVATVAAAFSGDARLLIVKAGSSSGAFTDQAEADAIRYAVRHGARIVNLSIGGPSTSSVERAAIRFAVSSGALVVAAAGNEYGMGNPVEYPAALVQPVGSNGAGGTGLAVAASTSSGTRAAFSGSGSWISLAAPGQDVYGALRGGRYGYGAGTSFATPQVAGAAALVWAADPALTAKGVARILEQSASGHGTWTPELGYGVIDVAAAVAQARTAFAER